jgi:hypothetical protein
MDRRTFVTSTAVAGVAALLASCLGAGGSTGPSWFSGPLTIRTSDYPALATPGGIARTQDGNGSPVAVVRVADSSMPHSR